MRVSNVTALLALVAIFLVAGSVPIQARGARGPCRQDIQALCPSVTPGPGSFRDCLKTLCPDIAPGPGSFGECLKRHEAQLSPACQQHLSQIAAKLAAWRQACQTDVQNFCGEVTPGHGNIIRCLRQHKDELSQPCKDQLAQHRRWRRDHKPTPVPGSTSGAS